MLSATAAITFRGLPKEKISSTDLMTKKSRYLSAAKHKIRRHDIMILDLIKKETDYSVKEEILNLLHARQSTRKSYLLAVDFYNTLDSEALKSDALIAITNLGSVL